MEMYLITQGKNIGREWGPGPNLIKSKYLEAIWRVGRQRVRQEYPRQSGRYTQKVYSAPWNLMVTC